jgi:hypothetical protein
MPVVDATHLLALCTRRLSPLKVPLPGLVAGRLFSGDKEEEGFDPRCDPWIHTQPTDSQECDGRSYSARA